MQRNGSPRGLRMPSTASPAEHQSLAERKAELYGFEFFIPLSATSMYMLFGCFLVQDSVFQTLKAATHQAASNAGMRRRTSAKGFGGA